MAKKSNKKTVEVQEENITPAQVEIEVDNKEYSDKLNADLKKEANNAINNIIKELSDSNKEEIENFIEDVNKFSNEINQENENKEAFLNNFEQSISTKTEDELRQTLEEEINRIDGLISKISEENKIPMTTSYWNGMQFDF